MNSRIITYCSNIHPGESWEETFRALQEHVPKVKQAVSPDARFPIGLRLSSRAARELLAGGRASFASWLREAGCYVPTINGFVYGAFHGEAVKQKVYLPDWHSRERAEYTNLLADLLAEWLPAGITGSISTVPIGFKATLCPAEYRTRVLQVLTHLECLKKEMGVDIVLALEPEPACVLETTADLVRFVEEMDLPAPLRERVGICLDCCHLAQQFEEPESALSLLADSGIRVGKVQVSSALSAGHNDRDALSSFAEPCYLHQVVIRGKDGTLIRYNDLPAALEQHRGEGGDEWRCHFHVPVFLNKAGTLGTTRGFAEKLLPLLDRDVLLEVETYSWGVLPPQLRSEDLSSSIIREIRWLQGSVNATDCRP